MAEAEGLRLKASLQEEVREGSPEKSMGHARGKDQSPSQSHLVLGDSDIAMAKGALLSARGVGHPLTFAMEKQ